MDVEISIAGKKIGVNHKPFIVAELSGNHNGSFAAALQLIDYAAKAGVDAVKLQTYTADTITLDCTNDEFLIQDPNSLWHGKQLHTLYKEAYTPWEWHKPLFERCRQLGLICFSTPFDHSAVDFLEQLNPPCYKIASLENIDIPLIRKVASTGKPLIMSTGLASLQELDESVTAAKDAGCKDLILLKCTSAYPASPLGINLNTIKHMQSHFNLPIGLSDHTLGVGVAIASIACGAVLIEKHFVSSRAAGGVDATFSMEPDEMLQLVRETQKAWLAMGNTFYGPTPDEQGSLAFRRSLYITQNIDAGGTLSEQNIRSIRPGAGLAPKYYDQLLGRKVKQSVKKGTPLDWDLLV